MTFDNCQRNCNEIISRMILRVHLLCICWNLSTEMFHASGRLLMLCNLNNKLYYGMYG